MIQEQRAPYNPFPGAFEGPHLDGFPAGMAVNGWVLRRSGVLGALEPKGMASNIAVQTSLDTKSSLDTTIGSGLPTSNDISLDLGGTGGWERKYLTKQRGF